MRPHARRLIAYGIAAALAAGLYYAGFVYELPPEAEHAMTQAEIKLRFAATLPPKRSDGTPVAARDSLIADAVRYIDEAEQLAPPSARTVEFRAYVEYLRGHPAAAAAAYARAKTMAAEPAQRGALALSEARMRAIGGDYGAALAVLDAHGKDFAPNTMAAAGLERARIRLRQQQPAAALAEVQGVLERDDVTGDALVATGQLFEQLGRDDSAASAYQKAAATFPLANYYGARLKAKAGEVDNALGMLECAVKDAGATVRSLMKDDREAWRSCADTERFRKLFPEMEAAHPGR